MIPERPLIVIGQGFQDREAHSMSRYLIETTTHKIRMTTYQMEISRHFRLIAQRRPVTAVELFHLFESPNRFGLPAFYTLHVWAWKENPTGTFVNWHSKVSCDAFSGQHP